MVFMLVEYMNGDIFQTSAAPPYQALPISLFSLNHIHRHRKDMNVHYLQ